MKTAVAKTDITGQRFARWIALSYAGKGQWNCVCDCGSERLVSTSTLMNGRTKSCGCFSKEASGNRNRTHGLTGVRVYRIWAQMKGRCQQASNRSYADYGARGITVCDRWESFENFLADMGQPPAGLTLDRRDNNGNYEPSNCRWATYFEQGRNRRNNTLLTHKGKTACIADWADETGISARVISRRIKCGWSVEQILTLPAEGAHHDKLIEFNGEKLGLAQWAKRIGMSKITLKTRLSRGWSVERALTQDRKIYSLSGKRDSTNSPKVPA